MADLPCHLIGVGPQKEFDMEWVTDYQSFKEFLSYVVLCAPDSFPKESFLKDHEQLTLEKAFAELQKGLRFAPEKLKASFRYAEVERLLEQALFAYRAGEKKAGSHLVQDIQEVISPGRFVAYAKRKGIPL